MEFFLAVLKGGAQKGFEVVLALEHEVLTIVMGGGGRQMFPPFKRRGGGRKKFYPVLRGGGRKKFYPVLRAGAKRFGPAIFPFCCSPPARY